jgi:hypothetical protein
MSDQPEREKQIPDMQPSLVTQWGTPFYGRAERIVPDGDIWWWTDVDGRRYPLRPLSPITNRQSDV